MDTRLRIDMELRGGALFPLMINDATNKTSPHSSP
jgi:hypothetical protein